MKDAEFKILIPKLKTQQSFKNWKEAILTYLGSKSLDYLVNFDVQTPVYLNPQNIQIQQVVDETVPSTISQIDRLVKDKLHFMDQSLLANSVHRLPKNLKHEIISELNVKGYSISSVDLPDLFLDLCSAAAFIIVFPTKVYHFYGERDSYIKARSLQLKHTKSAQSIIRSTISLENVHLFDANNSVYHGFHKLCAHYERDNKLERINIKQRLSRLKVKNLQTYMIDFKRLLSEYESAGGNRDSEDIVNVFLTNLPNEKYLFYKTTFQGDSIDAAFLYFHTIAEKELNFEVYSKPLPKTKVTAPITRIQQVMTHSQQPKNTRCVKCGGFGHKAHVCPNTQPVCHLCGSADHYKKNCTVVKVVYVCDEPQQTYESSDSTPYTNCAAETNICNAVHFTEFPDTEDTEISLKQALQARPENPETDNIDSDSIEETVVAQRVVVNSVGHLSTPYSCRFKNKCLKLVLDTGSSRHITGNRDILSDLHVGPWVIVENAFGKKSRTNTYGSLQCLLSNNLVFTVDDVVFCKEIDGNLLSIEKLMPLGYSLHVLKDGALLKKDGRTIYKSIFSKPHGSYLLHATTKFTTKEGIKIDKVHSNIQNSSLDALLLHSRFGHASETYLRNAGFKLNSLEFCHPCAAMKQSAAMKGKNKCNPGVSSQFIPQAKLEKLHMDTVGPFSKPISINHDRYFVSIVDEWTKYLWAVPVKSKDMISSKVCTLLTQVMTETRATIRCIRSDNGTEFVNKTFQRFLQRFGIRHERSNPHTPSENGVAERANRTLQESMRTLLHTTKVPTFLWNFAVVYSSDIWNSLPRLPGQPSPYQLMFDRRPDYERFKLFGAHGYAKITRKTSKFTRTVPALFCGLGRYSKSFLTYLPRLRAVIHCRDAVFDEVGTLLKIRRQQEHQHLSHRQFPSKSAKKPLSYDFTVLPAPSTLREDDNDNHKTKLDTENADIETPDDMVNDSLDYSTQVKTRRKNQPLGPLNSELSQQNIITTRRNRKTPVSYKFLKLYFRLANTQTLLPPKTFRDIRSRVDSEH